MNVGRNYNGPKVFRLAKPDGNFGTVADIFDRKVVEIKLKDKEK